MLIVMSRPHVWQFFGEWASHEPIAEDTAFLCIWQRPMFVGESEESSCCICTLANFQVGLAKEFRTCSWMLSLCLEAMQG